MSSVKTRARDLASSAAIWATGLNSTEAKDVLKWSFTSDVKKTHNSYYSAGIRRVLPA